MSAHYSSKHGIVSRQQGELYMAFTDMRNFVNMLPEDKRQGITADFDTIHANIQGFSVGVRVTRREPYCYIGMQDDGAPFNFGIDLHFDVAPDPLRTEFYIEVTADLNLMMKMMIGGKIKDALDKIVDGLVAVSEGRRPEGMPDDFKDINFR